MHRGRIAICGGGNRRRPRGAHASADRRGRCRSACTRSRSSFLRGTDPRHFVPSGGRACRRGFCRSRRLFVTTRGSRPRAPRRDPGPRHLRSESSKPPRYAGDSAGTAAALALSGRARHGEGVLQGAFLSPTSSAAKRGSPTASTTISRRAFFNAFPLPQRESGTRQTLRYIGDLFAEASHC